MEIELNETQKTELENLKSKHGKVRTLFVPLDEDDNLKVAVIFVKKPDGIVRNMIDAMVNKGKTNEAITAALKALRIGGDDLDLVLKNDDAMASLDYAIAELFAVQKTVLKKN
jgi:hypothetical protein